jgi:translation initiation factor 3 subunit A
MAREGIFQYRNLAQNTNVTTIETVIKRFIDEASLRLEKAQLKANQINLALIDDLEAAETPESIIMNTVSNEDSKDRTDRQVVTPWLRFLWEAYRTALDTLRNNSKLENFYQVISTVTVGCCKSCI